ncbi:hypothetical protein [Elizabethkingia meningoseptica]|uniref:hypothetical protein n=1 Tax=Elizabethkingia meningoseptica TaxID=238 RepID=UPI0023B1C535|nr:hypothetical protein [Elizabethkingia meningoseptica]MDE5527940.1 hypothetical protein [Elizabethkingia meningoseptica]
MRDISELESNALKFWPKNISELEQEASIIPKLIESQDRFISLLNISDASPFAWKNTLESTGSLPANLFLKHLIVLSDVGGEQLMRLKKELPAIFADSKMKFVWNETQYEYTFKTLKGKINWNNTKLKVDGFGLSTPYDLSSLMEDISMLLLFGGNTIDKAIPDVIAEKCVIGNMLGNVEVLEKFVRERYIWVSRITGGATANTLGQLSQNYVKSYLEYALPEWRINKDSLPNVSQNERTILSVDIVARSPNNIFCAIEVSFQVTTNSTIERKAGQAKARQELLHSSGHKIAYVIDGAGNFQRQSALRSISQYSDFIVTFKDEELNKLVEYLKSIE